MSGLTFSPDSQYIAGAYARSAIVEVWHAEICEPFAKFTADTEAGFYTPMSFSPDTRLIASTCGSNTTDEAESIIVWDMEDAEQIASLSAHTNADGNLKVWDVQSGSQHYELKHPLEKNDNEDDETICDLQFSFDGKILASESNYDNPASYRPQNRVTNNCGSKLILGGF